MFESEAKGKSLWSWALPQPGGQGLIGLELTLGPAAPSTSAGPSFGCCLFAAHQVSRSSTHFIGDEMDGRVILSDIACKW